MATTITAGNATNGLTLTPDNTGALELKTGTGAGTTALTLDSSQNATVAGTLKAAGVTTALYPLVSGTSVTASGTAVDFTSIPSWVKRITVMFTGVSTNGTSVIQLQVGSGSVSTTGYSAQAWRAGGGGGVITSGIPINSSVAAADVVVGMAIFTLISSNIWVCSGWLGYTNSTSVGAAFNGSTPNLSGTLDRVRITTVNGTDTFDAGSVNILYE